MKLCLGCQQTFAAESWRCPACGHAPAGDGSLHFAPGLDELDGGFEARFFPTLSEIEPGSWWFRSRNRLIVATLRSSFPDASSLLEIGCGTGFVLAGIRDAFPKLSLMGSELFTSALGYAQQRLPDVPIHQMDARRIPFRDEFSVVGAFDVLEHIDEDEAVIAEMGRAVRPGGGVMVTVPQHPSLWSRADDYSHHKRRYRRSDLTSKLERANLVVEKMTSFVTLLAPLMLAARRQDRRRSEEDYDPIAQFRIPPTLDRLLEVVMTIERASIRSGASLPLGGSLLAVARRPA